MAGNTISGGNAKKYANYARMGGVVLLVAAGGLWALELPGMQKLPEKPAPAPISAEAPKAEASQRTLQVEPDQVSDAADRLEMAWLKADKPAAPIEEIEDKPEPPSGPEWAYLGPIKEAGRSLAMVSVEGTQRILGVGRALGDSKLVGIDDDRIVLETKGVKREVRKSMRTGPTVAWLRSMPANAPMVGTQGAPGQAGQMSPEVIQRLRERGIDPAQAQRFRDMGNGNNGGGNGRNRGQPGNNGPGNGPANGARGAVNFGGQTTTATQVIRGARPVDADNAIRVETAN